MKKTVTFLIILSCFRFLLHAAEWEYVKRDSGLIEIYHAEIDSAVAATSMEILGKKYREMATDFALENSDTISIIITPSRKEFRDYVQGHLPKWTEAFAAPSQNLMVLKSPRWDRGNSNFAYTLIHELLHLVIHQKLYNREFPRWLDEGLALFYSGEQHWNSMTAISKAAFANNLIPLRDIDFVLTFNHPKAELAYQESFLAVKYLLANYDIDALQIILNGIRDGKSLDNIFYQATGSDFDGFENEWQEYIKKSYRWYWIAEINDFIWIAILALAVFTFILIRWRNKRTIEKWEEMPEDDEQSD